MNKPKYQVGDLVVLKPELWRSMPENENSAGLIVKLGVHTFDAKSYFSYFVRFEKLVHILNDRIIYADDILQHYPVVK